MSIADRVVLVAGATGGLGPRSRTPAPAWRSAPGTPTGSPPSYRRWPAKRDLVVAALGTETSFSPPRLDVDARAALGTFVRQAIATLIDSGAVRILGPRRGLVEGMLRAGIERGEIRFDIDPLVVTEMIAGAVIGHHAILGLGTSEAWIDALVDHVWAAIEARPDR